MSFTYRCEKCGHKGIVQTVYKPVPSAIREWAWMCRLCGHKITERYVEEIESKGGEE